MSKKLLSSAAMLALVLGLSACGDSDDSGDESEADAGSSSSQSAGPQPDLSEVPDVVATVNGEEISKEDFEARYQPTFQRNAQQAQMQGQELADEQRKQLQAQVATQMVDTELALQEAKDRGLEASDDDIEAQLKEAAEQQQLGSVDELLSTAEEQGVSEEFMRGNAEDSVLLEKLAEDLGYEEPTEKELKETYKQQKQQMESQMEAQQSQGSGDSSSAPEVPSFEDQRDSIEEELTQQKQNEVLVAEVKKLKKDADIENELEVEEPESSGSPSESSGGDDSSSEDSGGE